MYNFIQKIFNEYFQPLPINKQKESLFIIYSINFCLAIILEICWGIFTPKFDSYNTDLIVLGFFIVSFVEIVFIILAMRHIDIMEQKLK